MLRSNIRKDRNIISHTLKFFPSSFLSPGISTNYRIIFLHSFGPAKSALNNYQPQTMAFAGKE